MPATTIHKGSGGASLDPAKVEIILSQIDSLPTLPAVAVRLLELTGDTSSNIREVVESIESDQSLAARIMATVHRANINANAASTVERAVVLLGFDAVRNLVLSVQVFETFSKRTDTISSQVDVAGLWKHSLAVGCAARLLAEAFAKSSRAARTAPKPEEAFICGLLHDLGKVALHVCFPKSYDRVVAAVEANCGCITDAEQEIIGVDHTIAGRRLAQRWKLPAMICESIWLHHHLPASTPTRISHPQHVQLVQLADRLVRHMRIGYSGNYLYEEPVEKTAETLGISEESLHKVMADLPELIEARAELIGLDRLTSKEVYQQALGDAGAELARLNANLVRANRQLEHRSKMLEALTLLNAQHSDEPDHEEVCRSAAEAAAFLLSTRQVAVFGCSPSRSIGILAAANVPQGQSDLLPLANIGSLDVLAEVSGGWASISILPGPLADRARMLLGGTPAWCWPIRHLRRLLGAFIVAGDPQIEPSESMAVLAETTAGGLRSAEAGSEARQLNEELVEMNRRLVQSQTDQARLRSLAMVGEMAAGAAHEMNNPLAVISGRAQLLIREGVPEDVRRGASLIVESAHRASQIVTEMMEFAKPSPPKTTVWPIQQLLGEVRKEWIEKGVLAEDQIQLRLSDALPQIRADVTQIKMLFDEVIRNSVEAMRQVPTPSLVLDCQADSTDERIVIKIQDNGCGMTPDVTERAMDPFFSYRPAGRGRGLGLSRAVRYAEINGGKIRLSSDLNKGTTVVVELPADVQR